jgi:hypothetical protein
MDKIKKIKIYGKDGKEEEVEVKKVIDIPVFHEKPIVFDSLEVSSILEEKGEKFLCKMIDGTMKLVPKELFN